MTCDATLDTDLRETHQNQDGIYTELTEGYVCAEKKF